ncbi:hypothetical protein L6452_22055 [Arctium lappa]|uniref:Uncharacterized protein n=1 Tax=Arctium lappa TaxID=4217 RepID=A0ACB9AZH9_ARCLA|nr:hypothetical protein L6452_22055 [Arctium lappa]
MPRVPQQSPVTRVWSIDLLRIREAEELVTGGFGLGDFAEPYDGNVERMDGAGTSLQEITPKNDMQDLNETYKQLATLKTKFGRTLDAASMKYPKAREITEWKKETTSSSLPLESMPNSRNTETLPSPLPLDLIPNFSLGLR